MPGSRFVDQEPDAFAHADGPQALGNDVRIAEPVGDTGLVVADTVGIRVGGGLAPGMAAAGDAPETLARAGVAGGPGRWAAGGVAGLAMSHVLGAAEADDVAGSAAAVGAFGGCLDGAVGVVEGTAAHDGLVLGFQDG